MAGVVTAPHTRHRIVPIFLAVIAASVTRTFAPVAALWSWSTLPFLVAAGLLYLLAHAMRAARLAVIAMPMLGLSFRTAFLLHLFVAPWSLVMPFKLDEAVRLYELHYTGKSWSRALVALLIDRSMDGLVLLGFALALLLSGRAGNMMLLALAGVGLTALLVLLFTLPVLLEAIQSYIFQHHYGPRALRVLRAVDYLRRLLMSGRATIRRTALFLAIITACIWIVELAAVATVLAALDPAASIAGAIDLMLVRADISWRILLLGDLSRRAATILSVTFFYALFAAFIPAAWLYGRRRASEPLRAPAAGRQAPLLQRL